MNESDFYLVELKILVPKVDYQTLIKLKDQESVTKEDLALCGDILLTSWRSYC